jgi:hypothetical protein
MKDHMKNPKKIDFASQHNNNILAIPGVDMDDIIKLLSKFILSSTTLSAKSCKDSPGKADRYVNFLLFLCGWIYTDFCIVLRQV